MIFISSILSNWSLTGWEVQLANIDAGGSRVLSQVVGQLLQVINQVTRLFNLSQERCFLLLDFFLLFLKDFFLLKFLNLNFIVIISSDLYNSFVLVIFVIFPDFIDMIK